MQIIGQLGGLSGLVGGTTDIGLGSENEIYIGMLKSRTMFDRIIDRFQLMRLYDTEYRQTTRKELKNAMTAQEDKESGLIVITVDDPDPVGAANMANAFVEELRRLNIAYAQPPIHKVSSPHRQGFERLENGISHCIQEQSRFTIEYPVRFAESVDVIVPTAHS